MVLGFDVGNTHIVTGIFDENGELLLKFRVSTNYNITEDELFTHLKNICDFNDIELKDVEGIIVSSVVPDLITIFNYLGKKYFSIVPIVVNAEMNLPLTFSPDIEDPRTLGADRIIDVSEAVTLFPEKKNIVVIDFGTATTFDIIEDKCYTGGSILPGINLSINALFKNTAKLPKIKFEKPATVFGRNTVEHINIGIYYGSVGQIKEILLHIKKKLPDAYVIATGGMSEMVSKDIPEIDECIPDLSISGLYNLYKYNK